MGRPCQFPQLGPQAGHIRFLQHGKHFGDLFPEPGAVAGALPAFFQREHFFRSEGGGIYFIHLVAQQFYFPCSGRFCMFQVIIGPARILPLPPGVRIGVHQGSVLPEGVQQGKLPFLGDQGAVVAGAVHVHQAGSRFPQQIQGARAVVQELAVGRGRDEALDNQVAVFAGRDAMLVQNGVHGGGFRQMEYSFHAALLFPGADERLVRPFSQRQAYGSNNDGFPRPGFPRDADESGTGFPEQLVHKGQVFNFQQCKHSGFGF